MDVLKQLLGRLHPLIVHLPIGFMLLGLLLKWYDHKRLEHQKVIPLIFFWGGVSAVLACVTGYLQYLGEGYAFETVKWHLWSGIATALFSFLIYANLKRMNTVAFLAKTPLLLLPLLLFVLISFTGHQGGNITHGEDYLVEPLPNSVKSALGILTFEEKAIALTDENWEEALLYEDVIKPILNNNCVSCHNPKKTKGALLLHSEDGILKGGESGEVLQANNAEESDLFARMILPLENDDHMPPEGKTQPSKEEIKLVGVWIDAGHPFKGSIKEIGLEKDLFRSFFPVKQNFDHPESSIAAASQDSILAIEKTGIHIDRISKSSNFLSISCINKPNFTDADFDTLLPIKTQIARLDLGGTEITDAIFKKLAQLPNLTILKLDNTAISGQNIELLSSLEHLKTLNLTSTNFGANQLQKLANFNNLQKVFVFDTKLEVSGPKTLNNSKIIIDYGNYELPQIASDSIIY